MEIPRHWRIKRQRLGLIGEVCPHCDVKIFPPRDICMECGGEAKMEPAFTWLKKKPSEIELDSETKIQVSTSIVTVASS